VAVRLSSIVLGLLTVALAKGQPPLQVYTTSDQEPRSIDTKLFFAIREGKVEEVRALLAKGANANATEANGWTTLTSLGGTDAQMLAIAKLLVAKGAKVDKRQTDQGYTPLTTVLNGAHDPIETVRYLLLKGANPNAAMNDGTSPLHMAVGNADVACVRELLAHGARLDARTNDKDVVKSSDPNLEPSARRDQLANDDQNAHLAEPGFRFSGLQPVHYLGVHWDANVADLLLKAGASLRATDDNGWTPLHYAVRTGDPAMVSGLLAKGADPNAASKGGYRPLHLALRAGYGMPAAAVVRVLIAKGADPKLKNKAGQTPLDLLRADAEWRVGNPSNDPQRAFPKQYLANYQMLVNEAAKALDPNAATIVLTPPKPDPKGQRYAPLDIGEQTAERIVRVENGQAVLELRLPPLEEGTATVTVSDVVLEEYDTLTPLPITFKRNAKEGKTLLFRFPEGAARGGDVLLAFKQEGPGYVGIGGGDIEGSRRGPGFRYDGTWSVDSPLPDRVMEFEILSVTRNGKPLPGFAGRRLTVLFDKPAPIVGLTDQPNHQAKGPKLAITYRYRYQPNQRWHKSAMDF
jgi:ankyrin repeat protein